MLALYRTLSPRYLRQRGSRAALIVASIALGVAILVATRALNQSLSKAAHGAVHPLAGVADLMVVNGETGMPHALATELADAGIPGLKAVHPLVIGHVALPDLDNRAALLFGVELQPGQAVDPDWGVEVHLTNPLALLPGRRPAFVGSELAAQLAQASPGGLGMFRVRAGSDERQVHGAGTVEAHGVAAALGGSVLVMTLGDAGALVFPQRPDSVTRLDLGLEPGADREQVRRLVEERLADRAEVRTAETNSESVQDVTAGLEVSFTLGGAGALVVGLFLVYNALSVSVAERRHDIGILRSVGATRGQIAGLFVGEASLLGLAGSALGLPLGLGLARVALGPIQNTLSDIFVPLNGEVESVSVTMLLTALGAGVATAMLAALVPALQAATEEPADSVRRVPVVHRAIYRIVQLSASALLIGGGIGCVAVRTTLLPRTGSYAGVVLTMAGVAIMMVGGLLAMPTLTALCSRLLQPVSRRCFGVAERLAADNLARSPGRTGLVVGALAASVALMLQTAGLTHSSEGALLGWVDETIAADLFVSSNSPISSGGTALPMDESIGRDVCSLPDVEAAVPVRIQRLDFRNRIVLLIAFDASLVHDLDARHGRVRDLSRHPRLREPGTALVSENFAALHGVAVGDRIPVRGRHGTVQVEVLGTLVDYTWNRGTIVVDRNWYRQQFDDDRVDVFDAYLRPGADPEAVRETILRRWGAEKDLVVLTRSELRRDISSMIRRLYGIAYGQQIVIGLVAALGVVAALLISVLQRRSELGLLRAVGATQPQVLRSVLAEATLMGLIGGVIGLVVGIPLEWYFIRVILLSESGFLLPVLIPWRAAGVVVALAVGVATLAGLVPALHAMRLRITDAIAYE